ncbi:rRNA maturation RNase YbeY [Crocinitomicaceae bacterium]|nr:rRNA maturation RNase YbeY [Crocinitomicaceae bacterium]MDB3906739.1 rRNA maturation RNase YbeY [Crocinitomicaceae bacterium]
MVSIEYEDIEILDENPEFFISWLSDVCKKEECVLGEIGIVFCSDAFILEANKQYLSHDYYTDIITFDYREGNIISGDLLISVDRVKENAIDLQVDWKNELRRVVVHGVLHILGYKDKSIDEEKEMREKEDLYLGFT